MSSQQRRAISQSAALTTSAGTTEAISIGNYASGEIFIPTGSSITTLTYHVAPISGGTFIAAYDAAAAAVTQTVVAARAYPIPSALFGAAMIKIVVNAAGSVDVNLKS